MITEDKKYTIGRFELVRPLGKGSQGSVYLGKDPRLDRFVAIKVLTASAAELSATGENGAPLEALISSKLNHPNIVPIYDAGECPVGPYLVFEYVEGETLTQVLKARGPYSVEDAVPLFSSILKALATAHTADVLHLDLSPRNILIDQDNTPRVMDFGLSRFATAPAAGSELATGTLRYMAPEHFLGMPLGTWTDVYALGSTFYELVTGHHAMQGGSIEEIQQRIVDSAVDLSVLNADPHGEAFAHFLAGAFEKNPMGRYADCSTMDEAFELFLTESGLGDKPASDSPNHGTIDFLMRRMQRKKDFPTISSTLADINRLTGDNAGASPDKLANVILRDLALTSKLLKLVNSAFYGSRTTEITSISHAVVVLGLDTVRMTANTLTLFGHLKGDSAVLRDSMIKSFLAGLIARHLAQRADLPDAEEAFICGMCQNLGENLVIYYFAEEYDEIVIQRLQHKLDKTAASRGVLGVSYAELGAAVARTWSLPRSIVDAIRGLPPGPVGVPIDGAQRTRDLAVFANRLCDLFVDHTQDQLTDAVRALLQEFEPSIELDYVYLLRLIHGAFEKLKQYSNVIEINVSRSAYCCSVSAWADERILALKAERAAS
ncbi:MAG: HDOD domain-containing protein [Gammaproteobacteria bacterium]